MKRFLLAACIAGMFLRDAGSGSEGNGGSDGSGSGTDAAPTPDTATPAPVASTPPASLMEIVVNHLNGLEADDKRAAIIAEGEKILGDVQSLAANTRNSGCINDIVAFQINLTTALVEDAITSCLDALKTA